MKYFILLFAVLLICVYVKSDCKSGDTIIPIGKSYKLPKDPEKKQCSQLYCVDDGNKGWLEQELCTFPWIKCIEFETETVRDYDYTLDYPECCPKLKCTKGERNLKFT